MTYYGRPERPAATPTDARGTLDCRRCHVTVDRMSRVQKYCPTCGVAVNQENARKGSAKRRAERANK